MAKIDKNIADIFIKTCLYGYLIVDYLSNQHCF